MSKTKPRKTSAAPRAAYRVLATAQPGDGYPMTNHIVRIPRDEFEAAIDKCLAGKFKRKSRKRTQ